MAFEAPACPQCQTKIGLLRSSYLQGRIGVKCPGCGSVLKSKLVLRAVVFVVLSLLAIALIALADTWFQLGESSASTFLVLLLLAVLFFVSEYISIHFISFDLADSSEKIRTDGETEMEELIAANSRLEKKADVLIARSEPSWNCGDCGEANPSAFEWCWKCSRIHDDTVI